MKIIGCVAVLWAFVAICCLMIPVLGFAFGSEITMIVGIIAWCIVAGFGLMLLAIAGLASLWD